MRLILMLISAWVSLSLIIRLWLVHRNDPFTKKFLWSLLLSVPFIGWVFYGAFYTPLLENTVKAPPNSDALNGHG